MATVAKAENDVFGHARLEGQPGGSPRAEIPNGPTWGNQGISGRIRSQYGSRRDLCDKLWLQCPTSRAEQPAGTRAIGPECR